MMNTISGHDGGEMGHTCMPSFRPHTRLNRPCLWPLDPWVIGYYRNNSNWFLFVLFFRLSAIAPPRAENTNCGIWLWPVILCQHEKILTVGMSMKWTFFPILPACWYSEEKVFLRWFAQKKRKNSQKWPDAEGGPFLSLFRSKFGINWVKKEKKILLGWFLSILWLILVINMSESVKKQLWKKKISDPP